VKALTVELTEEMNPDSVRVWAARGAAATHSRGIQAATCHATVFVVRNDILQMISLP
jgi:hypothetical protein